MTTPQSETRELTEEFQDYHGQLFSFASKYDFPRLFSGAALRGIASIVVSVIFLRTPSSNPDTISLLLAVILLAWALGSIGDIVRDRENRVLTLTKLILLLAAAVGLILWDRFTVESLGRTIGSGLLIMGVVNAYRVVRRGERGERVEPLVGSVFYLVAGTALVVTPRAIIGLGLLLFAFYWFVAGVVTVVTAVRVDTPDVGPGQTWRSFLSWVQERPNTADDRTQLYEKLFYEGPEGGRRLSRFFVLMGFATSIAAFGVIADSTAVVIGAMLVAPLMTPLMGTSLSIVMGWPRRASMSAGVAFLGVLLAIGLSVLFGWIYGPDLSTTANSQVASRIAPTMVDLMIAIAAGGAGGFALSRPDVSDSLPGVAVAIALVPPLAVVGLMTSQTNYAAAAGALLLFTTNLVAILLVGGMVFILTGVVPILRLFENTSWAKRSLGMVGALAIGVIAILGVSADTFNRQTEGVARAQEVVVQWLEDAELEVIDSTYTEDRYAITLAGPEPPPPADELARLIDEEFDYAVSLEVTWVQTSTDVYEP